VAYTVTCIRVAKINPHDPVAAAAEDELAELADGEEADNNRLARNVLLAVGGLIVLGLGSDRLVAGGEFLAEEIGVSKALIALTLVAFGTSLPELATTVVACLKNEAELAAGNAIGSCLFNLLCVTGVTALIKPITRTSISTVDLIVMTGFVVATFLLIKRNPVLDRKTGILILAAYLGYIVFLGIRG
jgi:cation:H+ antiporter